MPVVIPRLVVEVFQHHDFQGRGGFVIEPVRSTGDIGFRDNISSVKVYKGSNFASSPNYKAILHEHPDFKGRRLPLGPGFYANLHDMAYDFGDIVSSISFGSVLQTVGPEWGTIPLIVECYEHVEFQGQKITVLRDIVHWEQGLHDAVSSVRIFKGPDFPPSGAEVILFQHTNFEGAQLRIQMEPMDYKKEIPNLHVLPQNFGDTISSIKIEGWSSSNEFPELVFEDEFIGNQMRPEWKWEDPHGGGSWSESQGYLEMHVQPGQDLWHGSPPGQGGNMDAPRLFMEVSGDFAIECRIRITPEQREHGGLIVWKGPHAFVRLEKTSAPHAFRGDVRLERHVNRVYSLVGRGTGLIGVSASHNRGRALFLRLERTGNLLSGFASSDGASWQSCGKTHVSMGDPVQVGLHALCPGNIPPTLTRFEYFRVSKRKSEVAQYTSRVPTAWQRTSDEEYQQQVKEERRRSMRDLS